MKIKVFNIQRFSVYDGPGIRTTVFLKGCSLACKWCHNPESISAHTQIQFTKSKCIGCNVCKQKCPFLTDNCLPLFKNYPILPNECLQCAECVEVCPAKALEVIGYNYEVDELVDIILRDDEFYKQSSGGVTFSGGEPLLQSAALKPLMKKLVDAGISCVIDTAGHVNWSAFEDIRCYTELFLYDIKAYNKVIHTFGTGCDNTIILDNFNKLYNSGANIIVRIPIIPDYNDNIDSVVEIANLLSKYPSIKYVELMPFHNIGQHKYESLSIHYQYADKNAVSDEKLNILREVLISKGLQVK